MASKISGYLAQIASAKYGRDVRDAIYNAISECYENVTDPSLIRDAFLTVLQERIDDGTIARMTIPDKGIDQTKLGDQSVTNRALALESVGTDEIQNLAVTAAKIANGTITADKLAQDIFSGYAFPQGIVGTTALAVGSVNSDKLAANAVTTAKIADNSVTLSKLAAKSVGESQLVDGSVTTAKLADDSVTKNKLKDGSVTNAKINDGAVSIDKLATSLRKRIEDTEGDIDALNTTLSLLANNIKLLSNSSLNYANGMVIHTDGLLYLTHDGSLIGNGISIAQGGGSGGTGGGGLSFNSGYVEDGYLHLTLDGEDIDDYDPIFIGTGSGGGSAGSKIVMAMYTASTFSVLQTQGTAPVRFKFTSVDSDTQTPTGTGTLAIYVGGILKGNMTVPQGDTTIDLFDYLAPGSNTVQLVMTDSYGATATRKLTITMESFSIEWNLGKTEKNTGPLVVYVTPVGSGTKRIFLDVDGVQYDMQEVTTSGRRVQFDVSLPIGNHQIACYGTMTMSGVTLTSETLYCAVAETATGSTDVVIAANLPEDEVDQYSTLAVQHRVIDPLNNPASVEYYINGNKYGETVLLDQSEQTFHYRVTGTGEMTLEIRCRTGSWSKTVTINSLSSDIQEVTDNLALKVDPNNITSLENFSYNGVTIGLSENFDKFNGGLTTDADGIKCIRVKRGDRMTLSYKMFAVDAKLNGMNAKFIYKVENASNFTAECIRTVSNNIGFTARANDASLQSEQSNVSIKTVAGKKTELEFNIEPDSANRIMTMSEKGKPARGIVYGSNDNFRQNNAVNISIGSDDADVVIYLIRCYTRDLTKEEAKANFIADGADAREITNRYDRNQVYDSSGYLDIDKVAACNPDLHILCWHAPNISTSKETVITGTLTHQWVRGGAEHSWTASNCQNKAQGTSSLDYVDAGCNEDFIFKGGIDLADGTHQSAYAMRSTSMPTTYLNYKANVASQEHANNVCLAEWYNRYQPSLRAARIADSRIRDTVEGCMAVLFFHNTGTSAVQVGPMTVQPDQTVFYSLGNLNNSKKSTEVFAYDPIVIEVSNNIGQQCRFLSDDLTGETWDGKGNFEFRYLDEDQYTEAEAKAKWQEFLSFVVSCNPSAATGASFETIQTKNGQSFSADTAAYRKAKWAEDAPKHLDKDALMYHELFTLFFCMPDNRAKNTFWGYNEDTGLWSICYAYDCDTAMGNDNQGDMTLDYGYMDTDQLGSRYVFNAADSLPFALCREMWADDLRTMYNDLETAGCWDIDAIMAYCNGEQDKACEALWIEDVYRKDIDTYTVLGNSRYLPMIVGDKRLQREYFLTYQRAFISSYFHSGYSRQNTASIRGYTPTDWAGVQPKPEMTVTPYSKLWVTVQLGSYVVQQRAEAGEAVTMNFGSAVANNTEIYIRCADFIKSFGDLACLYPGTPDFSKCSRLERISIGSSATGYQNTNLSEINIGNSPALKYINVENCPNLKQELDMTGNYAVEQVLTRGSGVTGVAFATHGRLKIAKLNGVSSITAKGLIMVEEFTLEDYSKLSTLSVEEAPAIPTLEIALAAVNINRVRLINIDWRTYSEAYDALIRLHNANGIDDDGHTTSQGVITGSVYFFAIGSTKYNALVSNIPTVAFSYGDSLEEYTVTFKNDDGTTLDVQKVESGGSAVDPIEAGRISTPTKAPTTDSTYTFLKWDIELNNITADTVVTATYSPSTRYNTVRYIDSKNGEVLETYSVKARGSCKYQGGDLERSGYIWIGWDKEATNVIEDMDIYSVYIYPQLPATVKDPSKYSYIYSDDSNDSSCYTFAEFYSIVKLGKCAEYGIRAGQEIKMLVPTAIERETLNESSGIVFTVHSFGHYELASGGMSNIDFYMKGVLVSGHVMNSSNTNVGGWNGSAMRNWLNGQVYPTLEPKWRNLISLSLTRATPGNQSAEIVESEDYLRIPSEAEVGWNAAATPYKDEISPDANEIVFSCYTDNNSRIKKTYNGTGAAQNWWTRTAITSNNTQFRFVNDGGSSGGGNYLNASNAWYVCVGFSA